MKSLNCWFVMSWNKNRDNVRINYITDKLLSHILFDLRSLQGKNIINAAHW